MVSLTNSSIPRGLPLLYFIYNIIIEFRRISNFCRMLKCLYIYFKGLEFHMIGTLIRHICLSYHRNLLMFVIIYCKFHAFRRA